jgi:hypothetical protein
MTSEENMTNRMISVYLYALGIFQLIGLNIAGFFWLAWGHGIRNRKASSRRWVIGIHSAYLLLLACGFYLWFDNPNSLHFKLFQIKIEFNPIATFSWLIVMTVIYALPVIWLLRPSVKQEFIESPR